MSITPVNPSDADRQATNWADHACFGDDGAIFTPPDASFRHAYQSI